LFDHLDEVTMIDFETAKILSHRRNIQRCVRLLATELTELERQHLHKRIAEERAELERLQGTQPDQAGAQDGRPVANLSVATSDSWRDKLGSVHASSGTTSQNLIKRNVAATVPLGLRCKS
jgi:hypothetical protein